MTGEPSRKYLPVPEIPSRPTDPANSVELARALMGDPHGLPFSLYEKRAGMFNIQSFTLNDGFAAAGRFYERLRSPKELVQATVISQAIQENGVPYGQGPLVELSVEIFPSIYDAPGGVVPMPGADEQSVGGHAVVPVCMQDGRLWFIHRWPKTWGANGAGSLSAEYVRRFSTEALAVRPRGGPEPPRAGPPRNPAKPLEILAEHYVDQESQWHMVDTEGDVLWCGRWLIGAGDGSPFLQAAVLLRGITDDVLHVGWLHARIDASGILEIEEAFVWPPYRGRGLGATLVGQSLLLAATYHYRTIRWLHPLADEVVARRSGRHTPGWILSLPWHPTRDEFAVAAATTTLDIPALLIKLANLETPGGVRLLWEQGQGMLVTRTSEPRNGIIISDKLVKLARGAGGMPNQSP